MCIRDSYKCHPNCRTCLGPGPLQCMSCHSDRLFLKGQCTCVAGEVGINGICRRVNNWEDSEVDSILLCSSIFLIVLIIYILYCVIESGKAASIKRGPENLPRGFLEPTKRSLQS
eukprot:TRINITY_DN21196_c0_g2_i1.p1 TRINITY_DN21196_c0_g2~~TRINITY_DN21196_c0_g2_i1.p1  ORF type:complete len:134 (+),score=23.71 TRINITY_DN21196_c0_g2_i1:60-404(+)